MNREELLAEAKRRYPIGTVFHSACTYEKRLISEHEPQLNYYGNIGTKDSGVNGIVYANEKWAEIISLPSEYPVGTKVKVILDNQNASDFNPKSLPYNGIYSIKLWASETFTIMEGEPKLFQSYNKEYQNCYPLGLDGKLVGYVYSEALEKAEQFVLPEKCYIKTTEKSNTVVCDWYDSKGNNTDRSIGNYYCYSNSNYQGWMNYTPERVKDYTEITFEQFKKYVLNKQNIVMKTFPITRSQFQDIHNIACSGWKSKITTMVTEKLGVFSTSCELDYETVKSMFKAATKEQMPVLVKIFPDYSNDKSIDLHKLIIDVPIHKSEEFENKSFWLNSYYNWEIKKDKAGSLCLVPTLK